ncbi:MAG: SDR family oxidoreductase [Deltaproteobacteria bacterium]|nr:SDR family oxidoreductase [Deltaproteobacteria bacterium]
MRVLVTGANGFIGRSLCSELRRRGFTVRGALRRSGAITKNSISDLIVVGDIDSGTNWEEALAGVDHVIHLAARVHLLRDNAADPLAEFRRVNRDGAVRLAKQAALHGVRRFIYLSSIKVNGEETKGSPFTESDLCRPAGPYGISKAEAEERLLALADKGGMEVVIIRPPLVYGPGVKANFLRMMQIIAKGMPLPLGAVHNKRSLVALDNLVDLLVTCLEHPAATNQIFLAGDDEDLSTTELLRRLGGALKQPARLLPVPQWLLDLCFNTAGRPDLRRRLCGSLRIDINKAKNLLGWQPPLSVTEGLKKTAEWYLKAHD